MRKGSLVGVCAAVVVSQGCTLQLPGNLSDPSRWLPKPVTPAATQAPGPTPADCGAQFKLLDKDGDKALTLDEWLKARGGKGNNDRNARAFLDLDTDQDRKLSYEEFATFCDGGDPPATPSPIVAPPTPPSPGRPGCEGSFDKFNADGDDYWSLEEFMAWEATRPRKAKPCAEGVFISNNGGGLISNNGSGIIASGGGMIVANRRQLMQLNNGGGLISNNAGGLISFNGSLVINNNNGRYVPNPCPPDDPAYRYGQFDHDGDGLVSREEFCAGPGARPQPFPLPSGGPEPYPFPSAPPPTPMPYPMSCDEGFFNSDADGDGLVSREEYASQRAEGPQLVYNDGNRWVEARNDYADDFSQKDLDGDGYLSLDESCYGGPEPEPTEDPTEWCSFYKLDDNGDAEVSWEEYLAWSQRNSFPPPAKEVAYGEFSGYDFDQNFVLTEDEWCGEITAPEPPDFPWPSPVPSADNGAAACLKAFAAADVDGRGMVSFEAYAQARIDQTRWIQKPSEEELKAQRQMWIDQAKPYDRNNDGRLDKNELQPFCNAGISLGGDDVAGYRR